MLIRGANFASLSVAAHHDIVAEKRDLPLRFGLVGRNEPKLAIRKAIDATANRPALNIVTNPLNVVCPNHYNLALCPA